MRPSPPPLYERELTCAQVGGASVDEPVLPVQHEVLARLLLHAVAHGLDAARQTIKNGTHVAAVLHGDDAELVLLVDPGEEGLVLVVEDAATLWPVPLHARYLHARGPIHQLAIYIG